MFLYKWYLQNPTQSNPFVIMKTTHKKVKKGKKKCKTKCKKSLKKGTKRHKTVQKVIGSIPGIPLSHPPPPHHLPLKTIIPMGMEHY